MTFKNCDNADFSIINPNSGRRKRRRSRKSSSKSGSSRDFGQLGIEHDREGKRRAGNERLNNRPKVF